MGLGLRCKFTFRIEDQFKIAPFIQNVSTMKRTIQQNLYYAIATKGSFTLIYFIYSYFTQCQDFSSSCREMDSDESSYYWRITSEYSGFSCSKCSRLIGTLCIGCGVKRHPIKGLTNSDVEICQSA